MSEVVSSFMRSVTVIPTVSTSPAYTANDQVGGIQTITNAALANGKNTTLLTLIVTDKGKQSAALTIFFFDQSPTVSSSDNALLDISDAIVAANCIGTIQVAAADYQTMNLNSVATLKGNACALYMKSATDGGHIYAVVKTTGTPTYASTTDLSFKYVFSQDI